MSFHLGTAPAGSTFKITMSDPLCFSPVEVTDSYTSIKIVKAESTSYRCELFDSTGNLLSLEGQPGAHVEPVGT
jgi:hypothetical protein